MGRLPLALATIVATAALAADASAATFTVTSSNDVDDTVCNVGHCSLREAINAANASGNADEIMFSAGHDIALTVALPQITTTVTVNGSDAANCTGAGQTVSIDGTSAINGLSFTATADDSAVCRLRILNFDNGISVTDAERVTIRGNRIGSTGSSTTDGNVTGIKLDGTEDALVGGDISLTADRNQISGNGTGVFLVGTGEGNIVRGNFIGTDNTGATAVPNSVGVDATSATMSDTVIGGTAVGAGNVISGNTISGIIGSEGRVVGNLVGLDASGAAAIANVANGINASGDLVIGGTTAAERNVISGNGSYGIFLQGDDVTVQGNLIGTTLSGLAVPTGAVQPTGVALTTGSAGVTVGGTVPGAGNVIAGHTTAGIRHLTNVGTAGSLIHGNTVGLGADGETVVPNVIGIDLTAQAQVGGTAAGARNVVSGNTGDGIVDRAVGTVIEGNTVGLSASGAAKPNSRGVALLAGSATRVAGNVLSGNTSRGLIVGQNTSGQTIENNLIGLAADGVTVRANGEGVRADKVTGTIFTANTISGNTGVGLQVNGGTSDGLVIESNRFGTDVTGLLDRGNGQHGLFLRAATDTRVAGNTISGNGFDGLGIGEITEGLAVEFNRIGVGADGTTALGNDRAGVDVQFAAPPMTLLANDVAFNAGDGVRIQTGSDGVTLSANAIRANGELGIDLANDGVTANDAGDGDTGDNGLQNFPVLTSAVSDGTTTTVGGSLDALRSSRVELFSSASCDPSGHGEAEVSLGGGTVAPGPFSLAVIGTAAGRAVTATATDLTTGESSELSGCLTVAAAPAPVVDPPVVVPPPVIVPAVTPKAPAKLRVLRNGVDDGVLDILAEITSLADVPGAVLKVDYESSGRHTVFTVPISGALRAAGGPTARAAEKRITIRKKLPSTQPKDTGIVTITYAGSTKVAPDTLRLRAADGQSKLVRSTSTLSGGKLSVGGTISSKARGVVRVRMDYDKPDGSTVSVTYNATISGGKWSVAQTVPADAAKGGQLSIQFTGYEEAGLRGEATAKAVP